MGETNPTNSIAPARSGNDSLARRAGVKAMFYVDEVTHKAGGVGKVALNATTKGDYSGWAKWTPSGTISLVCLNESATEWFASQLGKDVEITFSEPADADLVTPSSS